MADFFKSAFGMLGQSGGGGGAGGVANSTSPVGGVSSTSSSSGNEFVGQSIQIGNMRLRVTRLLAEGGYAIVYVAQDVSTGVDYALKVQLSFENSSI